MFTKTDDPLNLSRSIVGIGWIVLLSTILPACVAYGGIVAFVSGKPWGFHSDEYKDTLGTVKDGEFWFVSIELSAKTKFAQTETYRLKRLDLKTGVERNTGLVVNGPICSQVWMNDELYLNTGIGIYKTDGVTLEKIADSPLTLSEFSSRTMYCGLFVYENQLTGVREDGNGGFRLTHLVDGQWVAGRRVLFPRGDRVWYQDEQRDRVGLLPFSSQQPALPRIRLSHGMTPALQVIQHGHQTHLLLSVYPDFSAYRNGFEFIDEEDQTASALAPENGVSEVSGWESINGIINDHEIFDQMTCDRDGPLFLGWGRTARTVRRHSDGHWEAITDPRATYGRLLADPTQAQAYIIENDGSFDVAWGRKEVHTIEGTVVQTDSLKIPGFMKDYLARWQKLRFGLLLAWLLHLVIVICGTNWYISRRSAATYLTGKKLAKQATAWRRSVALAVDLAFVAAATSVVAVTVLKWPSIELKKHCDALFEFEVKPLTWISRSALVFFPFPTDQETLLILAMTAIGFFLLIRTITEGRSGTTPGKWLTGIQTVRTTLRPCGPAKSLLRNVFCWIDFAHLITPLPAAISLMLSPHRQRLGDRVAETVVISAGSVRDDDPHSSSIPSAVDLTVP